MGLTIIIGAGLSCALGIILAIRESRILFLFLLPMVLFLSVPLIINACSLPPMQEFKYQADVLFNRTDEDCQTIYFSQFKQDDNKILLTKYSLCGAHWTNFKGYDVINKPLTIIQADNDNQFIYKNRLTGVYKQ